MQLPFHATARLLSSSKRKSSAAWLARQSRDPYVKLRNSSLGSGNGKGSPSRRTGLQDASPASSVFNAHLTSSMSYRSRSAFKLLEINQLAGGFLTKNDVNVVVDLGAAPGGWSQVVAQLWGGSGDSATMGKDLEREGDVGELVEDGTEAQRRTIGIEGPDIGKDDLPVLDEDLPRSTRRALKKLKKSQLKSSTSDVQENEDVFDPLNIDDDFSLYSGSSSGIDGPLIVAIDLLPIAAIHGVHTIQGDFLQLQEEDEQAFQSEECYSATDEALHTDVPTSPPPRSHPSPLQSLLGPKTKVDVILSDMAANLSGNKDRDVQSSLDICYSVFEFAKRRLRTAHEIGRRKGGVLLIKHFTHPLLHEFRTQYLVPNFHDVRYVKPESSRSDSSEAYYLCQGWKGIV